MSNTTNEEKRGSVGKFVREVLNTDKKIGELNGKWAVMLKIAVLTISTVSPLILAWAIWVTSSVFAIQYHIQDTIKFRDRIDEIEKTLTVTPEKIDNNKKTLEQLSAEVKNVSASNAIDHQSILVQLSKIQTQIEHLSQK